MIRAGQHDLDWLMNAVYNEWAWVVDSVELTDTYFTLSDRLEP